jgi:uncharacterized coiled-coil DUF342 family protein
MAIKGAKKKKRKAKRVCREENMAVIRKLDQLPTFSFECKKDINELNNEISLIERKIFLLEKKVEELKEKRREIAVANFDLPELIDNIIEECIDSEDDLLKLTPVNTPLTD